MDVGEPHIAGFFKSSRDGGDRLLGNLWQWEGRFQRLEAVLGDMSSEERG